MQKRIPSVRLALAVFAAISLLAAACSSGDSSDTTAAPSGATETTAVASGGTTTNSSPIVKDLQLALQAVGYHPGTADGIYGQNTVDAVKEFQADAGITVDGKYGPETHEALEEAVAGSDFNWDDFVAVKNMQTEMKALGYYDGEIDGEYGPETVAGVKAVQADCGLQQDGIYGPETHACLTDLGGDA
jgi:peptidoglycan hydrolase-like protein with peptidoglycan-binding domain